MKDWKEEFDEIFTYKIPEEGGGHRIILSPTEYEITRNFIQSLLDKKDKEHKVNIIDTLNDYSNWLMKQGYLDTDWYCEEPKAVDEYVKQNNLW